MPISISKVSDPSKCLSFRYTVFVEEQNVPVELERDEFDASALHFLAQSEGTPTGTARIVLKGDTGKIGRDAVLKQARGTGRGAAVIKACLEELRTMPGVTRAALGAQLDALGFYERLGFTAYGDVFDDAGIDHRMMELRFDT